MQVFNSFQEMAVGTGALQPQSVMSVFNTQALPDVMNRGARDNAPGFALADEVNRKARADAPSDYLSSDIRQFEREWRTKFDKTRAGSSRYEATLSAFDAALDQLEGQVASTGLNPEDEQFFAQKVEHLRMDIPKAAEAGVKKEHRANMKENWPEYEGRY